MQNINNLTSLRNDAIPASLAREALPLICGSNWTLVTRIKIVYIFYPVQIVKS